MKKVFLSTLLFCAFSFAAVAQKYAYVNTGYILDNIPEYADAQAQLDDLSVQWQKEIEAKFTEIDKLYKSFQNESVLLPDDMKKKREDDIIKKEKEAKDLQKKRFGNNGDLYKKRQELVKPIQEKVYSAIEEIAAAENYALIFDKTGTTTLIYTNPKYDISEQVLDKLGYTYKPQEGENKKK
jgi:outer membrane protein